MSNLALIVDDDLQTLYFFDQVLQPTGMEILKAQDGLSALENLQSTTPCVLFLDMLLPITSGMEVLKFIYQTPRLNSTYVVVVSAHNSFPPSEQLGRVDAFFVKPILAKDIREAALYALQHQTAE
jgi:CheY-like chemotaxis protein